MGKLGPGARAAAARPGRAPVTVTNTSPKRTQLFQMGPPDTKMGLRPFLTGVPCNYLKLLSFPLST